MENQINKEIDVNCNKLKLNYYKCIKNDDPKIGDEMRFMAKNKLKEIDKYKIDSKILNKCSNPELITCLNNKYRLKEMEEAPLMDIFSKQYDRVMEKITRKKNNTDTPNQN